MLILESITKHAGERKEIEEIQEHCEDECNVFPEFDVVRKER